MKNTRKNLLLLTPVLLALTLAGFTACHKSAEDVAALISESEAAEIVETAVSARSAGLTMPTVDMAQILDAYLDNCGVPGDTTLQKSNANGFATYNYTFGLEWLIHCNGLGLPLDASVDVTGNGAFSTARWAGSDQGTGTLTFTGLGVQETAYVVNGAYTLTGDLTGDLRRVDPTIDCTTTVQLTDVRISKSTYQITGGGGTVQVVATNGQGNTRTLDGAIVFNGDGTVTVTVNGHEKTFEL